MDKAKPMSWFVVHTQAHAEMRAIQHLERQGFRAFLPRIRKVRRHARKSELVVTPLFPRYLFIDLDLETQPWRAINGTRGVVRLLTSVPRPQAALQGFVERLLKQSDEDAIVPLSALGVITQHTKVKIVFGPFTGQVAELAEDLTCERNRVQVLLNLLGVQSRVKIPHWAIEAA